MAFCNVPNGKFICSLYVEIVMKFYMVKTMCNVLLLQSLQTLPQFVIHLPGWIYFHVRRIDFLKNVNFVSFQMIQYFYLCCWIWASIQKPFSCCCYNNLVCSDCCSHWHQSSWLTKTRQAQTLPWWSMLISNQPVEHWSHITHM